jgi:Protein of unknown function (DUF2735)
MNTSFHRESAKIYEFPVGGRAALGGSRAGLKPAADIADLTAARTSEAAIGESWYHEAAIREAMQGPKV